MSLGLTIFTIIHVLISLAGIGTGLVMLVGQLGGKRLDGWTAWFFITTVATSVTGFFFPFHGFTPGIGVGIISLLILPLAIYARYFRHMAGHWRAAFVISATGALYLNFFVLVVQSFMKVPALHALAPTQSEPPFAITQGIVFLVFATLGTMAVLRFRPSGGALPRAATAM